MLRILATQRLWHHWSQALEQGLNHYATAVLRNYLQYYTRDGRGGLVRYRGLEMAQTGRMLTMVSMYTDYTGDPTPLLEYLPKVKALAQLLLDRHAAARQAVAPSDPAFGMITGNDEADLWELTISNNKTEVCFQNDLQRSGTEPSVV